MISFSSMFRFFGVVEDIQDPLEIGRVRVRVFGIHSESKDKSDFDGIPTEELLWMHTQNQVESAQISGVGSNHGLIPGATVTGYFIDGDQMQQGIVDGSLPGMNGQPPDPSKGFNDPTGQFPTPDTTNTSSVSPEARGQETDSQVKRDHNTDIGQQPANVDTQLPPQEGDVETYLTLDAIIAREEGNVLTPYRDSEGYWTIGIGHLITRDQITVAATYPLISKMVGRNVPNGGSITTAEANNLFNEDVKRTQYSMAKQPLLNSVYNETNNARKTMLINMSYQMGAAGVEKFQRSLTSLKEKKYDQAYTEFMSSKWAKQTGARANRVCTCLRNGNFLAYEKFMPNRYGSTGAVPDNQRQIRQVTSKRADIKSSFSNIIPEHPIGSIGLITEQPLLYRTSLLEPKKPKLLKASKIVGDEDPIIKDLEERLELLRLEIEDTAYGTEYLTQNIFAQVNMTLSSSELQYNIANRLFEQLVEEVDPKIIALLEKQINTLLNSGVNLVNTTVKTILGWVGPRFEFGENSTENEDDENLPPEGTGVAPDDLGMDVLFNEPVSSYKPEYGKNHVTKTPGGHVEERDDTPGFERYNRAHPSGTFEEIGPDGYKVNKIFGNNFLIVNKDNNVHVYGNANIIIEGNAKLVVAQNLIATVQGNSFTTVRGNSNSFINGNAMEQVNGNLVQTVKGNVDQLVEGKVDQVINGNVDQTCHSDVIQLIEGNITSTVNGDFVQNVEGSYTVNVNGERIDNTKGSWNRNSFSGLTETTSGTYQHSASRIDLIQG